jgi:hypothetical protein
VRAICRLDIENSASYSQTGLTIQLGKGTPVVVILITHPIRLRVGNSGADGMQRRIVDRNNPVQNPAIWVFFTPVVLGPSIRVDPDFFVGEPLMNL